MKFPVIGERGVFITFEGGEGVGKSTQITRLRDEVTAAFPSVEVVITREPGGTPAAEALRHVVLDPSFAPMDPRAEALAFAAARADHVAQVIKPALLRGALVLCDRYIDSSVVYQGVARGLGINEVEQLSLWATQGLLPDTVLVLDLPSGTGLSRVKHPDRLEDAGASFHEAVREGFLMRAATDADRYVVIDASTPVEVVAASISAAVYDRHADSQRI